MLVRKKLLLRHMSEDLINKNIINKVLLLGSDSCELFILKLSWTNENGEILHNQCHSIDMLFKLINMCTKLTLSDIEIE